MNRSAPNRAAIALAATFAAAASVALPLSSHAQQLVPLHIRSFTLETDAQRVQVGQPFHLLVHAHVDEVLTALDQTTLPGLYGFQSEGDERTCAGSKKGGTDCTESLQLVATIAGERTLGPVTLDAIDANTGRPSRFGTNIVTIHVEPDPFAWVAPSLTSAADVLALAARLLLVLISLGLAFLALRWIFSRARKPTADMFAPTPPAPPVMPPPYVPPAPPPSYDTFMQRYRMALAALQAQPNRANVVALRALVRERCGAGPRETLGDLLARNATQSDPTLTGALRAIERAAFVEDANLGSAIVAAYPDLERMAGAPA